MADREGHVRVSILIPVYNEFPTLLPVLERVIRAELPAGCEKEIIVVNDGSTDGTPALLEQIPPDAPMDAATLTVWNGERWVAYDRWLATAPIVASGGI